MKQEKNKKPMFKFQPYRWGTIRIAGSDDRPSDIKLFGVYENVKTITAKTFAELAFKLGLFPSITQAIKNGNISRDQIPLGVTYEWRPTKRTCFDILNIPIRDEE